MCVHIDKVISLAFEAELKLTTKKSDIKKDLNNLNIIPPKFLNTLMWKSLKSRRILLMINNKKHY